MHIWLAPQDVIHRAVLHLPVRPVLANAPKPQRGSTVRQCADDRRHVFDASAHQPPRLFLTTSASARKMRAMPLIRASTSPLQTIIASLPRVAASTATVLVTGESGAGKEGIACALHELSPRAQGPMVPVNCGAIPESLLESELFGHVRGAFTGADRRRIGRFEAAAGGTLFLDEIGELALSMQVKLLRVLQERVFQPVGASQPKNADFRLVAATNRDLREQVGEGHFRQDLFFRLDVVRIHVPPLRDRPMDVPVLVKHFIARHGRDSGSAVDGVTAEAIAEMQRYPWPGNVRELENFVQGVLVLKPSGKIERSDVRARLVGTHDGFGDTMGDDRGAELALRSRLLGPSTSQHAMGRQLPDGGLNLRETVEALERDLIREALLRSDGNRTQAANLLCLNRTTLVEKLKRMPDLHV